MTYVRIATFKLEPENSPEHYDVSDQFDPRRLKKKFVVVKKFKFSIIKLRLETQA